MTDRIKKVGLIGQRFLSVDEQKTVVALVESGQLTFPMRYCAGVAIANLALWLEDLYPGIGDTIVAMVNAQGGDN